MIPKTSLSRKEALALLSAIVPYCKLQRTATYGYVVDHYRRQLNLQGADPPQVSRQLNVLNYVIVEIGRRNGMAPLPPISVIVIDKNTRRARSGVWTFIRPFLQMTGVKGADDLDLFGDEEDWEWAVKHAERAVWSCEEWPRIVSLIEGMTEEEFQSLRTKRRSV